MKTERICGNMGFLSVLTLIFIVLKLTAYINWSWLWVLAPLWIPFSIALVIAIIFVIVLAWNKIKIMNKRKAVNNE